MTTIGSTTYSYFTYSGLTRGNTQPDASATSDAPVKGRSSVGSALSGTDTSHDDGASAKLSSALWELASTNTASARDEDVWQDAADGRTEAEKQFGELAEMTLAERIRAKYLEARGMTEESLAQMDPEARAAIEEEIRKAVQQAVGAETELDGDTADAAQTAQA